MRRSANSRYRRMGGKVTSPITHGIGVTETAVRYFELEDERREHREGIKTARRKVTLPTLKFLQKQD